MLSLFHRRVNFFRHLTLLLLQFNSFKTFLPLFIQLNWFLFLLFIWLFVHLKLLFLKSSLLHRFFLHFFIVSIHCIWNYFWARREIRSNRFIYICIFAHNLNFKDYFEDAWDSPPPPPFGLLLRAEGILLSASCLNPYPR